jgi:hypothetical protein
MQWSRPVEEGKRRFHQGLEGTLPSRRGRLEESHRGLLGHTYTNCDHRQTLTRNLSRFGAHNPEDMG